MTEPTPWAEYMKVITDDASGTAIAARTGFSEASVSRWLRGKTDPHPRQVVAIAREYGINPLQALIATGYLDEGDVGITAERPRHLQLRDFTDLEIAKEMVRRVAEPGDHEMLEAPLDENHPAMADYQPAPLTDPEIAGEYSEHYGVTFDHVMPAEARTREEIAAERATQKPKAKRD